MLADYPELRDRYLLGAAMRIPFPVVCATAVVACVAFAHTAQADTINVIDIIPATQSSETGQNAEPSLAVDPRNPNNMIAGTFSSTPTNYLGYYANVSPYWKSTDGGNTWASFGNLPTVDKSIAWRQDGASALTATLNFTSTCNPGACLTQIQTYSGTTAGSNFGSSINTFNPRQSLDQPWIRTGPSGQTYVAFNNLAYFNPNGPGKTASVMVSSNNGSTYASPVILDTVGAAGGQDAPSVRTAINGSTVYAVFTRWGQYNSIIYPYEATYTGSQVVVVKSTDSGASFSAGVTAANTTGWFANAANTPYTLGQERTSSDVAIAVDPGNANRVVVAYGNAPTAGQLQLHVIESTDGGATWTNKFTTSSSVRSGLPAVSILAKRLNRLALSQLRSEQQ
jgi:hypothetical protein